MGTISLLMWILWQLCSVIDSKQFQCILRGTNISEDKGGIDNVSRKNRSYLLKSLKTTFIIDQINFLIHKQPVTSLFPPKLDVISLLNMWSPLWNTFSYYYQFIKMMECIFEQFPLVKSLFLIPNPVLKKNPVPGKYYLFHIVYTHDFLHLASIIYMNLYLVMLILYFVIIFDLILHYTPLEGLNSCVFIFHSGLLFKHQAWNLVFSKHELNICDFSVDPHFIFGASEHFGWASTYLEHNFTFTN